MATPPVRSPAAPLPIHPLVDARPGQTADNRLEQGIVYTLVDEVTEALTDRHGCDHYHPWNPGQQVRIGVLGFTVTPPAPPDGTTSEDEAGATNNEEESGDPSERVATPRAIDNPGVIGLDFVVETDAETITLACSVDYALYQQLWPELGTIQDEAARLTRGRRPEGDDDGGGGRRRRRRPQIRMSPNWRRYNRSVPIEITIPIGDDETNATSRDIAGGDPLLEDARQAVDDHYRLANAARRLSGPQTLSANAPLGDEHEYQTALNARLDSNWTPDHPEPKLVASVVPTVDGAYAVSVSITNATDRPERPFQDLALYDTRLVVDVTGGGRLVPQPLGLADEDCRYREVATVVGRGRGCVADGDDGCPDRIWSDTLPLHEQRTITPATVPGADVHYGTLAADPMPTLNAIAVGMRTFLRGWSTELADTDEELRYLIELRDQFEDEIERFELGCDLLGRDANLLRSFRLANQTFDAASDATGAWRLFQLVYIVAELSALAVRTNPKDARLRAELDAVDVLWFPTGGGKTEAYLGLICTLLFYDRMRGKQFGHSAWLLFPLRMLSVQQLARIAVVLHHANVVRDAEFLPGDEFTLGYLVGAANTPNRLAPPARNGWWPGLDRFAAEDPEDRDRRRLVGHCSNCGNDDSVGLDVDMAGHRLLHVCRNCSHVLPIHASDEELFRCQSSVVVSTVDKITSFSYNGEFTSVHRGPTKRCPAHGWFSFGNCPVPGCTLVATDVNAGEIVDPVPALWIQDELHLVREELGVFASHYHTLLAELAAHAGLLPPKVLAATATIEQYQDQLRQVYGRRPRMFPAPGPTLERSFYVQVTDDTQRLYLGMLPAGGGTAKVDLSGRILRHLIDLVHDHLDDPTALIAKLGSWGITVDESTLRGALFNYELTLGYVNNKGHGVNLSDDVQELSDEYVHAGADRIRWEFLTGETPIGDLAVVVAAVTGATLAVPRSQRHRSIIGTSLVSHGIDLARLNLEVVVGMPPSYADYIQATSRAGRSHVGLITAVFDRNNRRETSVLQSFLSGHRALDRMVEPVPVNRFASRAVERTLPGIVAALLHDEARDARWVAPDGIVFTRRFRPWWNTNAAMLNPQLEARIRNAYTSPVTVNPGTLETQLADSAIERWDLERQRMQLWQADYMTDLFSTRAMSSLRDVDEPVEFGGGARAEQVVDRLFPAPAPPPPGPAPARSPARRGGR